MTDPTHPLSEAERKTLQESLQRLGPAVIAMQEAFRQMAKLTPMWLTPAEARAILSLRRAPSDGEANRTPGRLEQPAATSGQSVSTANGGGAAGVSAPTTPTDGRLPSGEGEWRCFHCDAVFTDRECAAEHFGKFEDCEPICTVGAERYRDLENQLASYRNDDDAATKEFYHLGAKHSQELVRSEERGYETGLRDARHEEIWRAYLAHPTPTDQSAVIARLKEALEPFATAYDGFERATTDARSTYGDALSAMRYAVRLPDFRRAATVLASASGEKAAPS